MRLHNLSPADGSTKERKRIGRGPASGQGKTAGKGHKGQKARAGRGILLIYICSSVSLRFLDQSQILLKEAEKFCYYALLFSLSVATAEARYRW